MQKLKIASYKAICQWVLTEEHAKIGKFQFLKIEGKAQRHVFTYFCSHTIYKYIAVPQ